MKVLFSGDIFSNFGSRTTFRSGIFFVAYALLKEFCAMDNITVTIYSSYSKKNKVEQFLNNSRLNIKTISVRPLPNRQLQKWLNAYNEKRDSKGLKPVKGTRRLREANESLDQRLARWDMRRFRDYDVFFSPCEAAPPAVEETGMPIYTIIHDLIPIVTGEFAVRKGYWLYDVLEQISPEKYYFCISECTRRDFLQYCPRANPEHVRVVYNGFEPKGDTITETEAAEIIRKAGLAWKRYILILGNVVPHKNVARQMKAGIRFIKESGMPDFRIAIVGSCKHPEEFLDGAGIPDDDRRLITFCGYVPDEHIQAYYRGAFCLSFTSLYEGFGLPALEAMEEGCPVVTSNTSSLPEVVGDAAICIPPEDTDAHVEAYMNLYRNPELREDLIVRGRERVNMFRWDHTAQQMIDGMKNDR